MPKLQNHFLPRFRGSIFYGKEVDKWSLPFLGADPSVVRRTQRYRNDELQKPPIQYAAYFTMPSIIYVAMFLVFGFFFTLLASFQYGRKLLEKVCTELPRYLCTYRKSLTSCSKSANKPSISCVRTACPKLSTSLEQAVKVNNL